MGEQARAGFWTWVERVSWVVAIVVVLQAPAKWLVDFLGVDNVRLLQLIALLQAPAYVAAGVVTTVLVMRYQTRRALRRAPAPVPPLETERAAGQALPARASLSGVSSLGGRRKASANRLVQILHQRWFFGEHGVPDPDFRISLYVPEIADKCVANWLCLARSQPGGQTGRSWPHTSEPTELQHAGVVVNSVVQQTDKDIPGVPAKGRSAGDLEKYRRRAFISDDEHKKCTWPHASLRTYLSRSSMGTIQCVLVVERESGLPIVTAGRKIGAKQDVSEVEAQFAAEIWGAAWEDDT
jgi:hypothetical protein